MNLKGFFLASIVTLVGLANEGCGSNRSTSSVGPSQVPPDVSGYWFLTATGPSGTFPGAMNIKGGQDGRVTGTFRLYVSRAQSVSGSVSPAGEMVLTYTDPANGEQGRIMAAMEPNYFKGTLTITGAKGEVSTFSISGDQ